MRFLSRVMGLMVLLLLPVYGAIAQQASLPEVDSSVQTAPLSHPSHPQKQQETEQEIQKREQSQRILGVVPMFSVTSRQHPAALTTEQKFHLFYRSTLDPFEFVAVGIQAGAGQASNEFAGYGQGAAGFGMRFGATFGDQISSTFFATFFYPVLLKADPRYFRMAEGRLLKRIGYSLAQEFVCRTDRGTRAFNFSNALGAVSAGGLSNAYYPSGDRGFGLTMSRAGIAMLYGSAGSLVDEFWPDIRQKVLHRPKPSTP